MSYQKQQEAARRVVAAWREPGINPGYHVGQMNRLRREWPTLSRAVESLSEAFEDRPKGRVVFATMFDRSAVIAEVNDEAAADVLVQLLVPNTLIKSISIYDKRGPEGTRLSYMNYTELKERRKHA